jgi:hypothetical protein
MSLFFDLPQDIITCVYTYDNTYRDLYSRLVMRELETRIVKHVNMIVIKAMRKWSCRSYPLFGTWNTSNTSFSEWFVKMLKTNTKATKEIHDTDIHVRCVPVSVVDGEVVVPFDSLCVYHFDGNQDDDDDDDDTSYILDTDMDESDFSEDSYASDDADTISEEDEDDEDLGTSDREEDSLISTA